MGPAPESRGGLICWLVLASVLAALALWRWPPPGWLATDFKSLLPDAGSTPWEDRAAIAAAASFDQQLVLLVQGFRPRCGSRFY